MAELVSELSASAQRTEETASAPLLKELWNPVQIAHQIEAGKDKQLSNQLVIVDEPKKATSVPLPAGIDQSLQELQHNLEKTQNLIKDLRVNCDPGLYDLELSRRSLTGNPYKILTAGSGLAMLTKSPAFGAVPLTGFAALQGYDDFKSLLNQETLAGRSKYTLGLLADTSMVAGSLGFLSESVPMRYKLPLLLGGLAVRTAVDFIPSKK